jgi:uncharacterized protein
MNLAEALSAATLLALAGAGHCLGMCGGISLGLSMAVQEDRRRGKRLWLWQALFAIGRVSTYTMLGALAGAFGQLIIDTLPACRPGGMDAVGDTYADAWPYAARPRCRPRQTGADRSGGVAANPAADRLAGADPSTPPRHCCLVRCGASCPAACLYTALALSVATGSSLNGAAVMLVFGLVTVPPVAVGGVATGLLTILRRQGWRRLTAVLTLIMAGWLFWQGLAGAHGHHHHHQQPDTDQQNPAMERSHPHHH